MSFYKKANLKKINAKTKAQMLAYKYCLFNCFKLFQI